MKRLNWLVLVAAISALAALFAVGFAYGEALMRGSA